MSGVDNRVVDMEFDNRQFGAGVKSTLDQLDALKKGLQLDGATKGLSDIDSASKKVDFGKMADNAERAGIRIRAMTIFVGTAIATISHQIVNGAENMLKSITIAPISAGFHEYETMMGSVQTILANTQRYGTKLPEVMKNLNELNTYADKTIYDFSQMTSNIGLFTNAGIRVSDATSMIKGFSNAAAASGTNAEGAASAAYQLSQALSSGTIRLMDWRSLTNVGMGNKNMQDGIINIAKAMGTFKGSGTDATKASKNFNASLEKGWLSADVMSNYLKIMAGDMDVTKMKALGLSDAEIKSFQQQQKTAEDAATKVRTFTQLIGTVREAVGSGWTDTFRTIFGDFNEATDLFTGLNNAISGMVGASANARNNVLKDWKAMGGRQDLILGLKAAWQALMGVLGPIKQAFRDIFPKKSASELVHATYLFEMFMRSLVPGKQTMTDLRQSFAGLFAVLDIVFQLVKGGIKFIAELFGHFAKGGGSVLHFTGNVGELLVKLDEAIKKGDIFGKFFDRLAKIVEAPIDGIKRLVGFVVRLIGALSSSAAVAGVVKNISKSFDQMSKAGGKVATVGQRIGMIFTAIWQAVKPAIDKIGKAFQWIGTQIVKFIASISFHDVLAGTGIAAFVVLVAKVRQAIDKFLAPPKEKANLFSSIAGSFSQLTETLHTMQQTLKAAMILEIAAAILVLAFAVSTLSKINAASLTKATTAVAVLVATLVSSMLMLDKKMGKGKALKLDMVAAGMIMMGLAIDVLASAVKKMSDISWANLAKGLTGVAVLLGLVVATVAVMPKGKRMITTGIGLKLLADAIKTLTDSVMALSGMDWVSLAKGLTGVAVLLGALSLYTRFSKANTIKGGVGILIIAAAIKVLASAMKDISDLSWNDIAKGLTTTSVGLAAFTASLKMLPGGNVLKGIGIIEITAALKIFASAMKDMASLSWNDIAKGMVSLNGGLLLIAGAMRLMPSGPKSVASAAALLIVSAALKVLASAMQDMGGMSWEQIAKSLVELAGSLLILAAAFAGMEEGLPGAAALAVASLGLKALAAAMVTMGGMSWSDIAAALVALSGALLVLAVGLTAMMVALPGALALAVAAPALAAFGLVMTMFGNMSWSEIGKSIVVLLGLFAALAIGGALSPLIAALAASLVLLGGAVAIAGVGLKAAGDGVKTFAEGVTALSKIDSQGIKNLAAALDTITQKIPAFIASIGKGIIAFALVIAAGAPAFGLAIGAVLGEMIKAVSQKIPALLKAFISGLLQMLTAIDKNLPQFIQRGADIIVKFLSGIAKNLGRIINAAVDVIVAFVNGISRNLGRIIQAGVNLIISFVNGVANAIRNNSKQMTDAGWNLATAIVDGMVNGIKGMAGHVWSAVKNMAGGAIDWAKGVLGIHSPSKEFEKIGKYTVEGFAQGIVGNQDQINGAISSMTDQLKTGMEDSAKIIADNSKKLKDANAKRLDDIKALRQAQQKYLEAKYMDTTGVGKSASARANSHASKVAQQKREMESAMNSINAHAKTIAKDDQAIKDLRATIVQASKEHNLEAAAYIAVTKTMAKQEAQLKSLSNQRDIYNQKLDDANKALDDATKTRDDYNKSLHDQYDTEASITKDTKLPDYVKSLQQQIVDTQNFTIAIQELRKRGLNDQMYKQLLGTGLDAMPFVQQLLSGGKSALDDINNLGAQLDKAAGNLGTGASTSLYQAGVNAAQGVVDGLEAKKSAIEKQMNDIADAMVNAIKTKLAIHSPSRVFAQLGSYSVQGLVDGLDKSTAMVDKSAAALGQTAIDSMKKTISGLGDLVNANMDVNPVIAPVLDLSGVQKDASKIGSMLGGRPISVGVAYSSASAASAGVDAIQAALADIANAEPAQPITFIQNNNSPKALSRAEIYRQTNNQLSVAKGALTSNARSS